MRVFIWGVILKMKFKSGVAVVARKLFPMASSRGIADRLGLAVGDGGDIDAAHWRLGAIDNVNGVIPVPAPKRDGDHEVCLLLGWRAPDFRLKVRVSELAI